MMAKIDVVIMSAAELIVTASLVGWNVEFCVRHHYNDI